MAPPFAVVAQILVNGVMTGGLYALEAMGLMVIYGVLKILNFAHGELILIGAYLTFMFYPISPYLGIVLSIPVLAVIAVAVQKSILTERVMKNENAPLIVTFGLSLILQNTLFVIFTGNAAGVQLGLGSFEVWGVFFPFSTVVATLVAIATLVTIYLYLTRTLSGTMIRAATESPVDAELVGIDVRRVRLLAFILGAVLAGFSGSILIVQYSVTPYSGLVFTLTAFTLITLGGSSIPGLVAGGLILGIAQSVWGTYFPVAYTSAVTFVIFLVVVVVRPSGLFGKGGRS